MRYAIIQGGIVVNVVVASAEFATEMGWILAPTAAPGDLYNAETGEFTRPAPDAD